MADTAMGPAPLAKEFVIVPAGKLGALLCELELGLKPNARWSDGRSIAW